MGDILLKPFLCLISYLCLSRIVPAPKTSPRVLMGDGFHLGVLVGAHEKANADGPEK